jgi:ribosome-associated toxin RatA of RatAB toxin-antitoxin module
MHSTITVDVEAPAALVFELARAVERWPALLPHYLRVTARARHPDGSVTAEMVAVRALVPVVGLGLPVAWRARVWAGNAPQRLRFEHHGGATDGMAVTWTFVPLASGCRVSIEHDFRPRIPAWGWSIDRLFVRPIARRTLDTFKSIAEAVAASLPEGARSERPDPPKMRST